MKEDALIVIEKLDASIVFSETGMTELLKEIETKAISHVTDITTEQGRKDIVSLAYKVTRSKTLIDNLGKGIVSEWKKKAKGIDIHRKIAREFLDGLKDKIKQPLAVWEEEQSKKKVEEERLEKIKINDRVTALFDVSVNIPYFEAAILSDADYDIMIDEATNKYNAEQLRLQEEQKAKEEEEAKLEIERADIARVKKEQEAKAKEQADKERTIAAELQAIEDGKKAEEERKERKEFEEKVKEDARVLAKKDAAEAEIARKAKEKVDREAKEQKTKEARLGSLQEIGFKYPFNDLGIMPDRQYCELYDSHRKVWDTEQQAIFIEKLKKERVEKEKTEAVEKARLEALKPDREKLVAWVTSFNGTNNPRPDLKSKEAIKILGDAIECLEITLQEISERIEEKL